MLRIVGRMVVLVITLFACLALPPRHATTASASAGMPVSACQTQQIITAKRSLSSAKASRLVGLCTSAERHYYKVQFWTGKKHRWTLYLRHRNQSCAQLNRHSLLVGPEALCFRARQQVRVHSAKLAANRRQIESLTTPTWCQGLSGNRAIGCLMAYRSWPSRAEWNSLDYLWDKESGWITTKHNPSSEACGIPQGLNNCSYGYDPVAQIRWGINYILGRYGNPSNALAMWGSRRPCWY